jgi:hypothetical protein
VASPKTTKTLANELEDLDEKLSELIEAAYVLDNSKASGDAAEGYVRHLKEMRRILLRARDQGFVEKLKDE